MHYDEYEETRKQTAMLEFLRGEKPMTTVAVAAATGEGLLPERKDSKRAKKPLLGGLFQKGRSAEVKDVAVGRRKVAVGRKTSDGRKYLQIIVDEVEREREESQRSQTGQQNMSGEHGGKQEKKDKGCKGEGQPAKTSSKELCKIDVCPSSAANGEEQVITNKKIRPPTQHPECKTGLNAKSKDKGKTKEILNPGGESSPVRDFRLPKPDFGSTGRDLASEGSGILERFGVAGSTNVDTADDLNVKHFIPSKTSGSQLQKGAWNQGNANNRQARIVRNQTLPFTPAVNSLWSIPGLSEVSERSASSPTPNAWIQAASTVLQDLVQDSVQESTPGPSKKPEIQISPRCSQPHSTGPWSVNNLPATPQHSAQNSIAHAWAIEAPLPSTPQHSAQNSIETKKSPSSTLKHSRATSAFSNHGSIIDDGQSEISSAEIMNAQSAEIVRAPGVIGYYSRNAAKLPKPGPAPTRALPSLPEGHDGLAGALGRANGGSQSQMAVVPVLERSPVKVPPSSPTGKYRYSPCKSPTSKRIVKPTEPVDTPEKQLRFSESSPTLPWSRPAVAAPGKHSFDGEMNAAIAKRSQIQRVRSTNALKGRDLQRLHSDHNNMEVGQPRSCHDERAAKDIELSFLSSARCAPGIPIQPITKDRVNSKLAGTGYPSQKRESNPQTICKVSPITVVAEQVPKTIPASLGRRSNDVTKEVAVLPGGGVFRSEEDVLQKPLEAAPGSEDKEKHQDENPYMLLAACPQITAKSRDSMETTNHLSVSDHHSLTNGKELENKLEARISALERKNTILLRVVMAVLDESGSLSGPSGGDRSSGLSSTSSLYGSRESRLEAKFDAVLSFLQENKRLSTEQ